MTYNISDLSEAELKKRIEMWSEPLFEPGGEAMKSRIERHSPLIQLAQNELTSRFVKKTTTVAIRIAVLSLIISGVSLWVIEEHRHGLGR